MNVVLFAVLTLRELVRRRLVAAVALLTLVIVAFTAWGLHRLATAVVDGAPIADAGVRGTAAGIVIMLAFLFSFVVALGAALVGAPAMAESIANGEILAVLARPVRRAEVVLGRWLGTVLALAFYIAVAGGLELLVVRVTTGYVPPQPLTALAYLAGVAAVVTTAAIALAARLPALAAGIVSALLFGLAWIGGIVEAIGLALGNARLADAGTIVALIFPTDALWRGALYALQPAVFGALAANANANGTVVNPFSVTSPPPPALIAWACGWVVAVLAAGVAAFRTRDL
ncbi:MAG: ABC-type transport system involved in multi-copper enzyme maturation, permease component [Candidatus Eremiobacteraeota bacterium]|nr:ABC-type transport system involved in multi-copper enzyme maturation, permease component [Candidatus Eremiobacteraeota bacterium]